MCNFFFHGLSLNYFDWHPSEFHRSKNIIFSGRRGQLESRGSSCGLARLAVCTNVLLSHLWNPIDCTCWHEGGSDTSQQVNTELHYPQETDPPMNGTVKGRWCNGLWRTQCAYLIFHAHSNSSRTQLYHCSKDVTTYDHGYYQILRNSSYRWDIATFNTCVVIWHSQIATRPGLHYRSPSLLNTFTFNRLTWSELQARSLQISYSSIKKTNNSSIPNFIPYVNRLRKWHCNIYGLFKHKIMIKSNSYLRLNSSQSIHIKMLKQNSSKLKIQLCQSVRTTPILNISLAWYRICLLCYASGPYKRCLNYETKLITL